MEMCFDVHAGADVGWQLIGNLETNGPGFAKVRLSGTDGGSIFEFDEAGSEFRVRTAYGTSDDLLERLRRIHIGRAGTLVGRGQSTLLTRISRIDPIHVRFSFPERNYLAYAARAFFGNGGRRLYVSRVFPFARDAANNNAIIVGQK